MYVTHCALANISVRFKIAGTTFSHLGVAKGQSGPPLLLLAESHFTHSKHLNSHIFFKLQCHFFLVVGDLGVELHGAIDAPDGEDEMVDAVDGDGVVLALVGHLVGRRKRRRKRRKRRRRRKRRKRRRRKRRSNCKTRFRIETQQQKSLFEVSQTFRQVAPHDAET